MTPTMEPCDVCEQPLPMNVIRAADLIYGPPSGSDFFSRLADELERHIARSDADPSRSTDPDRDEVAIRRAVEETIGQGAVLDALGITSFTDLTAAFRHFGHWGECRP
jgi:hypothetical protein